MGSEQAAAASARGSPRICALIPVFNHGLTVAHVVRGAREHLPVIAIDDGSTDDTAARLAAEPGVTVLGWRANQGKGAALQAGFNKAAELGFTHALTIDADGQHPVAAIPHFIDRCRENPGGLIVGVRDLRAAEAPLARRLSNALSTWLFRLETGLRLKDTQCGFRVYPLDALKDVRLSAGRYAFELEIMVKAAWAGLAIIEQPITVDYKSHTSKISHFHPLRDFARVGLTHLRLAGQALFR